MLQMPHHSFRAVLSVAQQPRLCLHRLLDVLCAVTFLHFMARRAASSCASFLCRKMSTFFAKREHLIEIHKAVLVSDHGLKRLCVVLRCKEPGEGGHAVEQGGGVLIGITQGTQYLSLVHKPVLVDV